MFPRVHRDGEPPNVAQSGGGSDFPTRISEDGSDHARIGLARGDWCDDRGGAPSVTKGAILTNAMLFSLKGVVESPPREHKTSI